MYCKGCGKQIDTESVFCKWCGASQLAITTVRSPESASSFQQWEQAHVHYQVISNAWRDKNVEWRYSLLSELTRNAVAFSDQTIKGNYNSTMGVDINELTQKALFTFIEKMVAEGWEYVGEPPKRTHPDLYMARWHAHRLRRPIQPKI